MVEFAKLNAVEYEAALVIMDRAIAIADDAGIEYTRTEVLMDLTATHHTCPLKMEELAKADDFDFAHDVFGIRRHLNRRTGQLEDCFLPRFAQLGA